ncbi:calcium-binding protein [Desulfovibrio sp. UCD-KL4C]|uniref:calcium-binding protein n=1 Tax=Desulfovibrio sp. UCD-KL4C TaxID=2578120 RepID=UPI0025BD6CFA|nr:calcium-binding protein [Desulfovibrio sp. UCD-KL4C]
MKKFLCCNLVALIFMVFSSTVFAVNSPEMRGTWGGTVKLITKDGDVRDNKAVFVINKQDGDMFSGYKIWFADKTGNALTEPFCGIIDADGSHLYFAEGDDGYTLGIITGKQTISLYYLESGRKAKAIKYDLERVRFTRGFIDIDKNGDKTIIRSEVVHVYPLNAERIMREADVNKDGKLSKNEWNNWKKGK